MRLSEWNNGAPLAPWVAPWGALVGLASGRHDQHDQGALARRLFSSATIMALMESMSSWSFNVVSVPWQLDNLTFFYAVFIHGSKGR